MRLRGFVHPAQQSLALHSCPTNEAVPCVDVGGVWFDRVGLDGWGDKEKFHASSEPAQYFSTVSGL